MIQSPFAKNSHVFPAISSFQPVENSQESRKKIGGFHGKIIYFYWPWNTWLCLESSRRRCNRQQGKGDSTSGVERGLAALLQAYGQAAGSSLWRCCRYTMRHLDMTISIYVDIYIYIYVLIYFDLANYLGLY